MSPSGLRRVQRNTCRSRGLESFSQLTQHFAYCCVLGCDAPPLQGWDFVGMKHRRIPCRLHAYAVMSPVSTTLP